MVRNGRSPSSPRAWRADGTPAFALNEVAVTQDEAENGIHYYLVEADLLEAGFEEPFVHFDEDEAPAFLHPAVRQRLADLRPTTTRPRKSLCPASSS